MNSWNAGGCCGYAVEKNIDDVGYIREVIDIIVKKYKVDENRVYVTGWSDGGYMSFRLACELSDKIRAAAPFASAMGIKDVTN